MKVKKYIIAAIIAIPTISFILNENKAELQANKINDKVINTSNIIKEKPKETILLVNNDYKLEKTYTPNLKEVNISFFNNATSEEKQMDEVAIDHIIELFKIAKEENINLLATSGYRSFETQEEIYNNRVKTQGISKADEYVAKPGGSEHQTGLAIDITNRDRNFVETSEEAIWLANNAHRFGFILRYPKGKEDITGKSYEPWHIRYVGKDIAKEIYEKCTTLEEYAKLNKDKFKFK